MTRRTLLLAVPIAAIGKTTLVVDLWNRFVILGNEWKDIKRREGIVDAHEIRLWREVRSAWHQLDKAVHYE